LREPPRQVPVHRSGGAWRSSFRLMRDRTMTLALICRAGSAAQVATLVAFVPILCQDMHLAAWQVGGFITVNVMVMTSLQMPAGRLADRVAKAPLVVVGQLVAAAGMVCLPLADGFFWLSVLAVLMGLGSGLAMPAMTALVVARGKDMEAGMGLTMGLFNSAFSVGVVIGPVAAGWVGDLTIYTYAFDLAGAMCGLSALGLLFARE
jgi:MFS transporter, DHA1 family, multidrug resistance protein